MAGAGDAVCRVLLTGGGGFVGSALRRRLAEAHPDWAVVAPPSGDGNDDVESIDVRCSDSVDGWVSRVRPHIVVHLAAVSAVTASVADPRVAWQVNLDGTMNVVLAMQRHVPEAFLLYMSSGDIYGASAEEGVLTEKSLLQPLNPYAASKAAADLLVRQAAAQGLRAAVMRPFNQIGPGQSEQFAIASFAAQVARIEAGIRPPVVEVGNLADQRDFIDVRDAVDAYIAVLDRHHAIANGRVFNICSGQSRPVGAILDQLLTMARIPVEVRVDPARVRATTARTIEADAHRARHELAWMPRRGIEAALADLLAEQRGRYEAAK